MAAGGALNIQPQPETEMTDEPQILSIQAGLGQTTEIENTSSAPLLLTFDFGPFGSVRFTVPIGGKFQYTAPTLVPRIFLNDVEAVITGGNVVPIDKEN